MNSQEYIKQLSTPNLVIWSCTPSIHKYINLLAIPRKGMISYASEILVNKYLSSLNFSINKWKKTKTTYTIFWTELEHMLPEYSYDLPRHKRTAIESIYFNYLSISKYIREKGYFNTNDFNLPDYEVSWLDGGAITTITTPAVQSYSITDTSMTVDFRENFGMNFPISPTIRREGMVLDHFLRAIFHNIIATKIRLIENSNNMFSIEWLFDLKSLINDYISSVDIILNTIYTKAEFGPLPEWIFDKTKLGDKHGRRIEDKFKWIHQISGNVFDMPNQRAAFFYIKEIRNHLNHFDPPCFAFTVEEVVKILNLSLEIGIIHIRIRQALKLPISNFLINFILQPDVAFSPLPSNHARKAFDDKTEGYSTSTWNNSI